MTAQELKTKITNYEERQKTLQESGLEGGAPEHLILLAEIAYQLARMNERQRADWGAASWPGPR